MKKLFATALFCMAVSFSTNAQGIDFGIKAGPNFANLEGDLNSENITSFHAGALVELNLIGSFSLQPELLYSSQGSKVEGSDDFNLDYLSIPVLAKFYILPNRLSLEAGPQFSFLLNDGTPEEIADDFKAESFDFAALGGIGLNITDNIFAQARYVLGLTEASKDAEVTNRVIQLSVGLKF